MLIGSIRLGVMTIYARVLPWWCVVHSGTPTRRAPGLGVLGQSIVFAIVWGLIGYALLLRGGTVDEQPSRVR
jgi:hypothetical protein